MSSIPVAKAPSFPFYPSDWVRDLQAHPLEIQGAWMRLMCQIWWEPEKEWNASVEEIARILGVGVTDAETTLTTILRRKIASGRQENDGSFTIWCRRWKRELTSKVTARARDQRYRDRRKTDGATDALPTPADTAPSSSSSSSSSFSSSSSVKVKKEKEKKRPKPRNSKAPKFSEDFVSFWKVFPSRREGNPKLEAFDQWEARLQEGVDPKELVRSAGNYAEICAERSPQEPDTRFILMARTFLGHMRRWEDYRERQAMPVHHGSHKKPITPEERQRIRDLWTKEDDNDPF